MELLLLLFPLSLLYIAYQLHKMEQETKDKIKEIDHQLKNYAR